MQNIKNNPLVTTLIIIIVVLLLVIAAVSTSTKTAPAVPSAPAATQTTDTTQVVSIPEAQTTTTPSKTPTAGVSTLQGQATATIHCTATTTGRCQTGTVYAKFGIKVYQNNALIQAVKLATDGSFTMKLPPGTYVVYPDWYTPGVTVTEGWKTDLPKVVTIKQGVTSAITFTVDYTQN